MERKTTEVYCWYDREDRAVMSRDHLTKLVKEAGLYLHRPDKGTGVVVIHGYKKRNDPRQYPNRKRSS
jgi:hypothetical protein